MSVTGIDSRLVLDASQLGLSGVSGIGSINTGSIGKAATSQGSSTAATSASVDISRPAELYAKLQQLQSTDPDKFKQVVSDVADKLKTLADQNSNSPQAKMLSSLAAKFQDVANGGDLSQLKPTEPTSGQANNAASAYSQATQDGSNLNAAQHHGGHHHHKSGGSGSANPIQSQLANIFAEIDSASGTNATGATGVTSAATAAAASNGVTSAADAE